MSPMNDEPPVQPRPPSSSDALLLPSFLSPQFHSAHSPSQISRPVPYPAPTEPPTSLLRASSVTTPPEHARPRVLPAVTPNSSGLTPILPRVPHPPRQPYPGSHRPPKPIFSPHPPNTPYPGLHSSRPDSTTAPRPIGLRHIHDSIEERMRQNRSDREHINRMNLLDRQARDRRDSEDFDRWCQGETWEAIRAAPAVRSSQSSTSPAPTRIESRLSAQSAPHAPTLPVLSYPRSPPEMGPPTSHESSHVRRQRPRSSQPYPSSQPQPRSRNSSQGSRNASHRYSRPPERQSSRIVFIPKFNYFSKSCLLSYPGCPNCESHCWR